MAETGERTPNVESLSQGKGGSGRVELAEIQNELNKAVSSAPNPSKAPLNYIDNMDEREKSQKEYDKQVREKQQDLALVLQASENKSDEIDVFRKDKAEIDAEIQKVIGSLYTKLYPHIDFLNEVATKFNEGHIKELEKQLKSSRKSKEKYIVTAKVDRELTPEEKEAMEESVFAKAKNQGIDAKNVVINYEIIPHDELSKQLGEISDKENDVNSQGFDEAEDYEETDSEEIQIPDLLQTYFQLTSQESKEKIELFLKKKYLEQAHVNGLNNLMYNLKDLENKYDELCHQSYFLSEKIEKLESELSAIDDVYLKYENDVISLQDDKNRRDQSYFLNSHKSTKKVSIDDFVASPAVKTQINHILNLYKKGLPIPKTILLYGGHDLGKTYAANVLSSELGLQMYHIKSYDIFNSEYPDPAEMLKAIFSFIVRKNEPCIIFLDEMEKFSGGSEGSPYQKVLENTLRHHIAKIKESNRDIIIIGAVSSGGKLDPSLLKQDVFQKQIAFEKYGDNECKELLQQIMQKKGLKFDEDVKISDVISKIPSSEGERNPEYIKCLIDTAEDYHLLNSEDPEFENIISMSDILEAMKLMKDRNLSSAEHMGYN